MDSKYTIKWKNLNDMSIKIDVVNANTLEEAIRQIADKNIGVGTANMMMLHATSDVKGTYQLTKTFAEIIKMKVDSVQPVLKTYKIKNHDSGKTYSVKAASYKDAKEKYNKHILKDSLTIRKMIKDGWSAYTFKTGLRSDVFKQYLRDRGIYFESSQDGEYTHFEVKNADEAVDRRANEIVRQLKDSITEDGEIAGWIAIYNGTKIEIKKSEADSLYAAKKLAILKFKEKFKHVKEHMITIAPGYNDSITEDAVIYGEWKEDGVWNVNTNDLARTKTELKNAGYKYVSHDVNIKGTAYKYTVQYTKDSITEDASFSNWLDKTAVLKVKPQIDDALSSFKKGGHSGTKYDDYSIYLFASFGPNEFELRYYYSTLLEKAIPSVINDKTSIVSDLLAKFNRITGANAKLEKTDRLTSRGKTEFLAKAESTGKREPGNEYAGYTPRAVELMFKKEKIDSMVKDAITEDALTNVQSDKLYKLLSKLDKYDLYELAYGGPSRGSIGAPKRDLLDDAFYKLVDKSLQDVNSALREYNLKLDSITEDDDTFIKASIAEMSRYVRNWDFMSAKERNNVMPGYSKSEGLAALKIKLAKAEASLKKDSITEDADIAQNDIKSSYLPEDANADNIQYLGFNEKRKLSFYGYGDRYFVHYDLEGRTEEIDKATVQKILKKNILGEIDENDLINKEPQSEEIVSDSFEDIQIMNDWKKKQERGDK